MDPLTDEYPFYTPYQFAGCEPIENVDLDGLEPLEVLNGISSAAASGGTSIAAKVVTTGSDAGKWAITWFKDGIAFRKVFKATGFFTDAVVSAAKAIGTGLTVTNSVVSKYTAKQQTGW